MFDVRMERFRLKNNSNPIANTIATCTSMHECKLLDLQIANVPWHAIPKHNYKQIWIDI